MRKKLEVLLRHGFIRSVGVLVGGTAAAQVLMVLVLPLLTRLYTPDDFSVLAVYASILGIVTIAACLRMEIAIPLPQHEEDVCVVAGLGGRAVAGLGGEEGAVDLEVVLAGERREREEHGQQRMSDHVVEPGGGTVSPRPLVSSVRVQEERSQYPKSGRDATECASGSGGRRWRQPPIRAGEGQWATVGPERVPVPALPRLDGETPHRVT